MSIFSILRGAKKAADEHKKKKNAAQSTTDSKVGDTAKYRYKHIPTHAALDSMNIGLSQKNPEIQDRIKIENRKIRALSPKRAAMIRARQRSVHTDKSTSGDSSVTSVIEEYHGFPRLPVGTTDMLLPRRIHRTYSHSAFDTPVKTRPRYRSSADSLRQSGRVPLSVTPESSEAGRIP
jgi:hypothetical protein